MSLSRKAFINQPLAGFSPARVTTPRFLKGIVVYGFPTRGYGVEIAESMNQLAQAIRRRQEKMTRQNMLVVSMAGKEFAVSLRDDGEVEFTCITPPGFPGVMEDAAAATSGIVLREVVVS